MLKFDANTQTKQQTGQKQYVPTIVVGDIKSIAFSGAGTRAFVGDTYIMCHERSNCKKLIELAKDLTRRQGKFVVRLFLTNMAKRAKAVLMKDRMRLYPPWCGQTQQNLIWNIKELDVY
ncbi:hypothetical protein DPMN_109332 [Dreissena polymorpha]|uniref:Uncharacterized protein n=1 Tax=Dreissena polymorpha TaxID=45954 RepID=A0A9D4QLW2_DREPO|nr:hypothetical protein DPMN_109332 [Dreissena polymorpha]